MPILKNKHFENAEIFLDGYFVTAKDFVFLNYICDQMITHFL